MTDDDLDRIERDLSVPLPVAYRAFMAAYPAGLRRVAVLGERVVTAHLADSRSRVVRLNRSVRRRGRRFDGEPWPAEQFVIGQGAGSYYSVEWGAGTVSRLAGDDKFYAVAESLPGFVAWLLAAPYDLYRTPPPGRQAGPEHRRGLARPAQARPAGDTTLVACPFCGTAGGRCTHLVGLHDARRNDPFAVVRVPPLGTLCDYLEFIGQQVADCVRAGAAVATTPASWPRRLRGLVTTFAAGDVAAGFAAYLADLCTSGPAAGCLQREPDSRVPELPSDLRVFRAADPTALCDSVERRLRQDIERLRRCGPAGETRGPARRSGEPG